METRNFKKGDKIRCTNPSDTYYLKMGGVYEVIDTKNGHVWVKNPLHVDRMDGAFYEQIRFVLDQEKPNTVDEGITMPIEKAGMTLPTDSKERKEYPMLNGCLRYFPAALAGVALISKRGNDKHNPGEELHHARGKSMDHGDCIVRHLIDAQDLLAQLDRGENVDASKVLEEASQLAWRALAYSQELHERFGAPLAPGAKK